jgi:hypothetical protein
MVVLASWEAQAGEVTTALVVYLSMAATAAMAATLSRAATVSHPVAAVGRLYLQRKAAMVPQAGSASILGKEKRT